MSDSRLTKGCPVCKAAPGGKCLESVKDGSRYIETPHKERWFEKLADAVGTAIGEAKFGG